jgi:hypothetical protein
MKAVIVPRAADETKKATAQAAITAIPEAQKDFSPPFNDC